MSRYPSHGIGRFNQQFAESESERNERLRCKRLGAAATPDLGIDEFRAQSKSYLDSLHKKENEIARLMTENIRLRRTLDQISREGECVYSRRLALNALKPDA